MSDNRLPTEVELAYEVMSCNAMRVAQEPGPHPHPCAYFRNWGTYHSYDYVTPGPPDASGIRHGAEYVGRAPLVPELLSGCRKAPIMAVGINPNLPGWWRGRYGSLNPLFDDYKQYAHYFRYRTTEKLTLSPQDYEAYGGGDHDEPPSDFELDVPTDERGRRTVSVRLQAQAMYEAYQALLDALADEMGWAGHRLSVGEDLSYGNMVACPSAKWITRALPDDPRAPPMTVEERNGIVGECFHERRYFLRQLFQSLPAVLLVFSQSTANALIGELEGRFSEGDPRRGEPIDELIQRRIRLRYGALPDGTELSARVIFAPHITGNPGEFGPARDRVVAQLVEEARPNDSGRDPGLAFNEETGHMARPRGMCVFCTMLTIGPCDYVGELRSIEGGGPELLADDSARELAAAAEKPTQRRLLVLDVPPARPIADAWQDTDQPSRPLWPEA